MHDQSHADEHVTTCISSKKTFPSQHTIPSQHTREQALRICNLPPVPSPGGGGWVGGVWVGEGATWTLPNFGLGDLCKDAVGLAHRTRGCSWESVPQGRCWRRVSCEFDAQVKLCLVALTLLLWPRLPPILVAWSGCMWNTRAGQWRPCRHLSLSLLLTPKILSYDYA